MGYEAFISRRYLPFRGGGGGVAVIAWISVLGVTIGVMVLLVVISVMNGFEADLIGKVIGHQSHVVVEGGFSAIGGDFEEIHRVLEGVPHVIGSAPVVLGQAMLRSRRYGLGAQIKGIDPQYEVSVTDLATDIVAGSASPLFDEMRPSHGEVDGATQVSAADLFARTKPPGILLGKELAKHLFGFEGISREEEREWLANLVETERTVLVISPVQERTPFGGTRMRERTFRVVGVAESGLYDYDSVTAYVSLPEAQYLYRLGDGLTRIEVRLDNPNKAAAVAEQVDDALADATGRRYFTKVWMDFNRPLFRALQMERAAMLVILTMIIMVAGFSVAASLIMTVLERRREIGVLRALGATRSSIRGIFLRCGALVGGIGTVTGCILAFFICILLDAYGIPLPGGGEVYYIDEMPVQMRWNDFLLVALLTSATCILAATYPARLAAKLVPVEALRYE